MLTLCQVNTELPVLDSLLTLVSGGANDPSDQAHMRTVHGTLLCSSRMLAYLTLNHITVRLLLALAHFTNEELGTEK